MTKNVSRRCSRIQGAIRALQALTALRVPSGGLYFRKLASFQETTFVPEFPTFSTNGHSANGQFDQRPRDQWARDQWAHERKGDRRHRDRTAVHAAGRRASSGSVHIEHTLARRGAERLRAPTRAGRAGRGAGMSHRRSGRSGRQSRAERRSICQVGKSRPTRTPPGKRTPISRCIRTTRCEGRRADQQRVSSAPIRSTRSKATPVSATGSRRSSPTWKPDSAGR